MPRAASARSRRTACWTGCRANGYARSFHAGFTIAGERMEMGTGPIRSSAALVPLGGGRLLAEGRDEPWPKRIGLAFDGDTVRLALNRSRVPALPAGLAGAGTAGRRVPFPRRRGGRGDDVMQQARRWTVTALFDSRKDAEDAVERLIAMPIPKERIRLTPGDEIDPKGDPDVWNEDVPTPRAADGNPGIPARPVLSGR